VRASFVKGPLQENWGWRVPATLFSGFGGDARDQFAAPIDFAKNSTWRPSRYQWLTPPWHRVLPNYVKDNNFIIKENDEMGGPWRHQVAQVQVPRSCRPDYTMEMVHKFYGRVLFPAQGLGAHRARLAVQERGPQTALQEAREFLTLRKSRIKAVQAARAKTGGNARRETAKV